ncbi:methyl-accepting chemotaxis protein [Novosphingobium colocasiae]|uniref:methyl-accepting chemotaxis protein n=1 Tax=Novosphingobium colocasiae TaxID=1256513 RepID=UPI0035B04FFA
MQLEAQGRRAGIAVMSLLAVALAVASIGIWMIRVGGPIDARRQRMAELTADILPPPIYVIEPYLEAGLLVREPAKIAQHKARLAELEREYRARLAHWSASELDAGLRHSVAASVGGTADPFWQEVDERLVPAVSSGDRLRTDASFARLTRLYESHRQAIDSLVTQTAQVQAGVESRSSTIVYSAIAVLTAIGALLAAGIVVALRLMMGRALRPLSETAHVMTAMAQGDLDAGRRSSHRDDEIGAMTRAIEVFRQVARDQRAVAIRQRDVVKSLSAALDELARGDLSRTIDGPLGAEYEALRTAYNQALGLLADLIANVAEAAEGVSSGSREIRAASDDLALRNERQAAHVENTAAALEQVVYIIKETALNTDEVEQAIADAHAMAEESRRVVREAITAMDQISDSSQKISQIVSVIDGIAFQTNLLALNAGVEAARAGDAGKGFAVVATEVRALAQRSADAARDIRTLILASTAQVGQGVDLVGRTGDRLAVIVDKVGAVNGRIAHISEASRMQATAIERINETIDELDRMTQQNAAMVEQSTAAARSLADQSGELSALCGRFRTSRAAGAARRLAEEPVIAEYPRTLALAHTGS